MGCVVIVEIRRPECFVVVRHGEGVWLDPNDTPDFVFGETTMTKKQIENFNKKLMAAVERDPERNHPAWREIEALLRRILASK